MSPVILKAGQYREPDAPAAADILIRPIEGRNGYAFGFWLVRPTKDSSEMLSMVFQDQIERLALGFDRGTHVQHRFEQFLRALNETLATQVREGAFAIPVRNVHAFIGVVCDGTLFFSGMGDLSAVFLHRREQGPYQVYNLFRSIQTEQALPAWEKPFAVVLDGDMQPGDVLCVSNHDLQRQLKADDFHRYLSALPPGSAAEKIRQHFPARTDLSLLILQAQDGSMPALERATPRGDASVDQMNETEDKTERLLEDQGPTLLTSLRERFTKRGPARAGTKRPTLIAVLSMTKTGVRAVIAAGMWAGRALRQLVRIRDRATFLQTLRRYASEISSRLFGRFRRLPRTSRVLFVAAGALVLALMISISILSRTQASLKADEGYKNQVAAVEERRDQAAAAVIYRDENKARTLYEETLRLASELPTDTPERATTAARLTADAEAGFDQLRHVISIPNPPVAADLSVLGTTVNGMTMVTSGKDLYVLGSDKRAYRLDADHKAFIRLETSDGNIGVAKASALDGAAILFLDDRPGLSRFDPEARQQQVTDLTGAWADLTLYGNRLYLLAPSADGGGQVLRATKTNGGFGAPTAWVRTKSTTLDDAVGLAIDGTVFVLKKNGTIVRFATGSEVGWAAEKADPPVTDAKAIWTDADSEYVYVLEPAGRRVIVYAKATGAFVAQYRSDSFADANDFLVDEKARTISILSGSKLYIIAASHLK